MTHYIVEENLRCFKCGSSNVGPLFSQTSDPLVVQSLATGKEHDVDSEFYRVHYDCLCCYTCKAWDFNVHEQWHHPIVVGGFLCSCAGTQAAVTYNDVIQDTFEVKCQQCGKEYELEKEQPL